MRCDRLPALAVGASLVSLLAASDLVAVELSPNSPRARAAAEAAATLPAGAAASTAAASATTPGRIRVKYREGPQAAAVPAAAISSLVAQATDARVQRTEPAGPSAEIQVLDRAVSEDELRRIAENVARSPAVEWAVPEKIERAQQVNDELFAKQWHYHQAQVGIRLPAAWNHSTGKDVVVAVLDTGIRPHADIAAHLLPGHDFVSDPARSNDGDGRDADATDPGDFCPTDPPPFQLSSWHGLHVSGTIAAVTNNNKGVAGIAREAKILPVRVLGQCGGSSFDITDAIRWAAGAPVAGAPDNPTPARVINLSLGGFGPCDADYADAILQARQRGVTVVVAAGNGDADAKDFRPANCEGVISVAATNRIGARAFFGRAGAGSNFGPSVKIAAPGGETFATAADGVLSTLNDGLKNPGNDSYEAYQGTSMAAPHVAGIVALMYQVHPTITPDEVLSILRSTSQPFPKVAARQCDTSICGAGIADAEAAVLEAAKRGQRLSALSAGPAGGSAPAGAQPAARTR